MILGLATSSAVSQGVPAKDQLKDYPRQARAAGLALGAKLLSPKEVGKRFVAELQNHYLVVEIGVFPEQQTLSLSRDQFQLLSVQDGTLLATESPAVAAANLQRKAAQKRTVGVTPQVGIGYESHSGDPGYGMPGSYQRRKGFYTRTGVHVGLGQGGSGASDDDRRVMETELEDKALPKIDTDRPVAGYLYFPKPDGKSSRYQLEYLPEGLKLVLQRR
jgi:hypothetical protein